MHLKGALPRTTLTRSRHASIHNQPQPRFQVRSSSQREYKAGLSLPWWRVEVSFRGEVMGAGGSFNKRDAEQAAARQALERLGEL
jgi:dsRNA-specific ribonuclease